MTEFNDFFKSPFTVDNIIFGFDEGDLKVLLIKRGEEPFADQWALPGHFVYPNEDLDTAAKRVLEQLTGLRNVFLEQVKTFGAIDRHPFGRVITVSYFSLIRINLYQIQAASIAQQAEWHSVSEVKELPFDHKEILDACFNRLKWLVRLRPVGFELLPPKFTLTELQHLYEAILETKLDKRNFRKKILSMHLLIDLDETQEGVAHRPARLYRFDKERYQKFQAEGFNFELKESKKKENTPKRILAEEE